MPTAVASFDDFDVDEPARKRPPRKLGAAPKTKGAPRRKAKKPPRFAFDKQRAVRWAAVGMSGSLALAIALGPSPAPASAAKPAPVERPEEARPPAAAPAPPARREIVEAPRDASDPIGQLIDGKALPVSGKAETTTVIGAQRALAKLGFALKPSGTLGPQTRKAIESFERDHQLPVNGELSHRLIRILAAASGMKIQQ